MLQPSNKAIALPTTHIKCDRARISDFHGKFSSSVSRLVNEQYL
ncbi:MAG: hypothetical protein RMY29_013625 [Nostoc sp. CreGUA01]|nr:hypothetical protein [Nostoc sp. CreGUA01]